MSGCASSNAVSPHRAAGSPPSRLGWAFPRDFTGMCPRERLAAPSPLHHVRALGPNS